MKVEIFVHGVPAPGGSKTGFYIKSIKRVVMAPASKKTKPWMRLVTDTARETYSGPLLTGPLSLTILFHLLRPKGHYRTGKNAGMKRDSAPKYPTVKPDGVKLTRSTEDALTGVVWRDDSQVVEHNIRKLYCDRDPGAQITVEELAI